MSYSGTEAKYRDMVNNASQLTWMTFSLKDLYIPMESPSIFYCDNLSGLHMTVSPMFHARSIHTELD